MEKVWLELLLAGGGRSRDCSRGVDFLRNFRWKEGVHNKSIDQSSKIEWIYKLVGLKPLPQALIFIYISNPSIPM